MSTCPDHSLLLNHVSVGPRVIDVGQLSDDLKSARDQLLALSAAASDASLPEVAECAAIYADLLSVIAVSGPAPDESLAAERQAVVDFVGRGLTELTSGPSADGQSVPVRERIREAYQRWGEYLELVRSPSPQFDSACESTWCAAESPTPPTALADDPESPRGTLPPALEEQARLLLAALGSANRAASTSESSRAAPAPPLSDQRQAGSLKSASGSFGAKTSPATKLDAMPESSALGADTTFAVDPEILDAFQDDTRQCLAAMERAALDFEREPANPKHLRQLCRELHTLKGASASVGWKSFAHRLHVWEEALQSASAGGTRPDPQTIFAELDAVRQSVQRNLPGFGRDVTAAVTSESAASAAPAAPGTPAAPRSPSDLVAPAHAEEETVRVKAAHLDRLMDTLSELVMLRNRRHGRAQQLKNLQTDLVSIAARVRGGRSAAATRASSASDNSPLDSEESPETIATDLLAAGRALREVSDPLAAENDELSQCIGQLRQDLVELRRLPVIGLFQRLERAVRDAARVEGKRVQLRFLGEQTGLERSLQERLYEPLLHIVRNAVSHGIESEADRLANGKPALGTVTLEARGGTNLLALTVRDDGRGLDYDALRRRGKELGLLSPDRPATRDELAQLIFRSGFSTRTQASQVSGRGVGMDVVAATLDRIHGWVEVDSTAGQGTQIKLLIPRRSIIEHAMVFRSCGRLFALPMQAVHEARGDVEAAPEAQAPASSQVVTLRLNELFGNVPSCSPTDKRLLVLDALERVDNGAARGIRSRVGLAVDEVIGPQEVVVRPLPHLLARHRLLAGISLSATAEIVLLLDAQRLADLAVRRATSMPSGMPGGLPAGGQEKLRMLVVDDSQTARQTITNALRRRGIEVDEAGDGYEALECLRAAHYSLVWLDMEMPRMTGLELLAQLRQETQFAAQPVVIASSRTEVAFRRQAETLGVVDYLIKPVADDQVGSICKQLVSPGELLRGNP